MPDKPKKLLVISDMFPTQENPISGVFVLHQVQALAQHYEIKVLSSFFPSAPRRLFTQTPNFVHTQVFFPQSRLFFPLTTLHYRKWMLPELRRILDEWRPDIIHVHDCRHLPELLCISELLKGLRVPRILTLHNIKTLPEYAEHKLLRLVYQKTLSRAFSCWDKVLFVNANQRMRMQELIPLENSVHIGNAICPAASSPHPAAQKLIQELDKDAFKILAVANLLPAKGLDLLIRAVYQLRQAQHNVVLRIVGDGAMRSQLLDLVLDLGMEKYVTLWSAQPNEVVRQLYPAFDLFALPSYRETFGIVYLEAMDAGIPIIGVSGQGIDGVVSDGENGLLCQPQDLDSLQEKILWVIQHPAEAKNMAQKGQQLVRKDYMMDSMVQKLKDIYESR